MFRLLVAYAFGKAAFKELRRRLQPPVTTVQMRDTTFYVKATTDEWVRLWTEAMQSKQFIRITRNGKVVYALNPLQIIYTHSSR